MVAEPCHRAGPAAQRLREDLRERRPAGRAAAPPGSCRHQPPRLGEPGPRSERATAPRPRPRRRRAGSRWSRRRGPLRQARPGCRRRWSGWTSGRRGAPPPGPGRGARGPTSRRRRPGRARRRGLPGRWPLRAAAGVTCGVSMPIWTTGPGTRAWASASRLAEVGAALGVTRPPAGPLGSRRPAAPARGRRSARGGRVRERVSQAASVSSSAAAASSAARSMPISTPEPGLRPARPPGPWPRRARAGLTAAPARSRVRRAGCPAPSPTPSTGCPRPAGGTRRRARSSATRPRGQHEQLHRVAEPAVVARRGRAGRPGGTPASARCRARPGRCRGAARPGRRRCRPRVPGPHAACGRSAAADRDVGTSGAHLLEQWRAAPGVHRAVAVEHRDELGCRGLDPGVHGRAVARRRLVDHHRTEPAARHVGGAVDRAVVDHDDAHARRAPAAGAPGRAAASSRHGMTRSQRGLRRTLGFGRPDTPPTSLRRCDASGGSAESATDPWVESVPTRPLKTQPGRVGRAGPDGGGRRLAMGVPALTGTSTSGPVTLQVPPLLGTGDPCLLGTGHRPAVLARGCRAGGTPPPWPTLSWRRLLLVSYVASVAWMVALALVDGRRAVAGARQPVRVPARPHARSTTSGRCCGSTSPASPRRPGQLAGPTSRATRRGPCCFFVALVRSGWAATWRRVSSYRARRVHCLPPSLTTLRALGAEAGPAGRRRSSCSAGRGLHGGLRGRRVRHRGRVGLAALAPCAARPAARVGVAGGAAARLRRADVLRDAPDRRARASPCCWPRARGGRCRWPWWPRSPSCWPSRRSGFPGGRPTRCCTSATGTGWPQTGPRATGGGATSRPSSFGAVRCCRRRPRRSAAPRRATRRDPVRAALVAAPLSPSSLADVSA